MRHLHRQHHAVAVATVYSAFIDFEALTVVLAGPVQIAEIAVGHADAPAPVRQDGVPV
ncbi:hypothetical protein LAD67_08480 [Escherichia coli]|nr:hypothetical protein [Escherichia coli]